MVTSKLRLPLVAVPIPSIRKIGSKVDFVSRVKRNCLNVEHVLVSVGDEHIDDMQSCLENDAR